ncbi:MAG: PKD domain-containing protein, partial [Bacteroidota bacterium]
DSAAAMNTVQTDTFKYISGNYISFDNGVVSFINSYGPQSLTNNPGVAVRITIQDGNGNAGAATLVTALIRNYTDVNNVNDSMEFHVWADSNGAPGADLITPIMLFPEATLADPQPMTRVDLRPLAAQLDSLNGDVYIGYTVPVGQTFLVQTTPGTSGRARAFTGTNWINIVDDYHFRAITTEVVQPPDAQFSVDLTNDPVVAFTDASTNNPSSWLWDFGDGNTDTVPNPMHTYAAAGGHIVCLTVTNIAGSDQLCQLIQTFNSAPDANFTFDDSNDPVVDFTDFSLHGPTNWDWDFDDNGATSTQQNPQHIFSDSGSYNVCLVASNAFGSDTTCQTVTITSTFPVADFSFDASGDPVVDFTDLSTENPTSWSWDFDDNGATSTMQNPTYQFSTTGTFNVCLTATNLIGSNTACQPVTITVALPIADFGFTFVNANILLFSDSSQNNPTGWSWDFDDGSTASSQNPSHQYPTTGGAFNVCLVASNSAGNSAAACKVVNVIPVGLEDEVIPATVQLFPNPMVTESYLVLPEDWRAAVTLRVFTVDGQEVPLRYRQHNGQLILHRGDLAAGTYLFELRHDGESRKRGKFTVH